MIQELVDRYALQTLSQDECFICLTPEMRDKFSQAVSPLSSIENLCPSSPVVVYRGVSQNRLKNALSRNDEKITDQKLLSRLFFYGDKAKALHSYTEEQANSLQWLKNIEDCSIETCQELFKRIQILLQGKDECLAFISNQDSEPFSTYFRDGRNSSLFVSAICRLGVRARDYYLYFLHTHENALCTQSFLVSTSSDFDIAVDCAKGGFVIVYAIPKPIEMHAISAESQSLMENVLKCQGLPLYNGAAHYPEEKEYAIRGALFPHYMIGVIAIHSRNFFANPHLFSEVNHSSDFFSGLRVDQNDFDARIGEETQYKRAVATFFEEGSSRTINF